MATSLSRAIPEQSTLAAVVKIGEWAVEPAANALAGKGQVVHLEPKAMEVLVFLAARAGQVVSREALLSAVWPGTVVGDEASIETQFITFDVAAARKPDGGWPAGTFGAQGTIKPIESGYYRFAFRRTHGVWLIRHQDVIHDIPYVF